MVNNLLSIFFVMYIIFEDKQPANLKVVRLALEIIVQGTSWAVQAKKLLDYSFHME